MRKEKKQKGQPMKKARLIASDLGKNQLPLSWTYPETGEHEGAQVLRVGRAIRLALEGEEDRDDWYRLNDYTHLAILELSGQNGDRGGLGYAAVMPEDVEAMHVISLSTLRELGIDLVEAGYDIDPMADWWDDIDADEYLDLIIERAETVEPDWIRTV
jgi:hypothetical protein